MSTTFCTLRYFSESSTVCILNRWSEREQPAKSGVEWSTVVRRFGRIWFCLLVAWDGSVVWSNCLKKATKESSRKLQFGSLLRLQIGQSRRCLKGSGLSRLFAWVVRSPHQMLCMQRFCALQQDVLLSFDSEWAMSICPLVDLFRYTWMKLCLIQTPASSGLAWMMETDRSPDSLEGIGSLADVCPSLGTFGADNLSLPPTIWFWGSNNQQFSIEFWFLLCLISSYLLFREIKLDLRWTVHDYVSRLFFTRDLGSARFKAWNKVQTSSFLMMKSFQ